MKVKLKHFGTMSFDADAGGNRLTMSASPDVGGDGVGARPMETVLAGLGGCSGIDVMLILKKSRQRVTGMEIEITAERADAVPAVFTRIHLHYIVRGDDLARNKVARAIELSAKKYCSVTQMLAHTATITHDFVIINDAPDRRR